MIVVGKPSKTCPVKSPTQLPRDRFVQQVGCSLPERRAARVSRQEARGGRHHQDRQVRSGGEGGGEDPSRAEF